MKGKSQIFSLEKSLLRITGHWAIKASISLFEIIYFINNFHSPKDVQDSKITFWSIVQTQYQIFPDIQTSVSNFGSKKLEKLHDQPKYLYEVSKIFVEQNLRLTKWAKIERLFFVFLI